MAEQGDDHDYGRLLVLQHSPEVHLAGIERLLAERAGRRPFEVLDATAGVPASPGDDVRGLLVLGGLMGVPDRDEHPWMAAELGLLRAAHEAGVPILGICLGAQLLATALGGEVRRREVPECGLFPLSATADAADDPVFAGWPAGGRVCLTHEDEVATLPEGAVAMLASDGEPVAAGTTAWRLGEGTYAVQFHPEIDPDLLAGWLQAGTADQCVRAGVDAEGLAARVDAEARFLRAVGLGMVGRWVDAVVGRGDPSPRKHRR